MQNLERAVAGRSVSTQTGSMTGECLGPHSRHRNLSLCPVPLQPFNYGFPAFLFACSSARWMSPCLPGHVPASVTWTPLAWLHLLLKSLLLPAPPPFTFPSWT